MTKMNTKRFYEAQQKFHSEQHDDELFNRVCINALNGIDVKSLPKTDFLNHQKWVEDNWDDLNAE